MNKDYNNYLALSVPADAIASTADNLGIKIDGHEDFSLEAWIRLGSLEMNAAVFSKESGFEFGVNGGTAYFRFAGGTTICGSMDDERIDLKEWHHLAVSYDRQFLRLYVNSECVATGGVTPSKDPYDTSQPLLIGKGINGKVRTICVYNVSLSADEIKSDMFNEPSMEYMAAFFDFTQNPAIDKVAPQRVFKMEKEAQIVNIHPSLYLQGTSFVMPSKGREINPGGNMIDSYTIQTYLYVRNQYGIQTLFANYLPCQDAGMALYLQYDDAAKGMRVKSLRGTDFDQEMTLTSNTVLTINKWVNITTVYNGEELSIFIDGRKDASGAFGPLTAWNEEGNPLIGGSLQPDCSVGCRTLQGNISTMQVWNKALTDQEVLQYSSSNPDYGAEGLTGYFDFTAFRTKNEVDNAPLALCDGAVVVNDERPAAAHTAEDKGYAEPSADYEIDAELLASFRAGVDFGKIKEQHLDLYREASKKEIDACNALCAECGIKVDPERMRKAWDEFINHGMPEFLVTMHRVENDFVLIAHTKTHSYVAYKVSVYQADECLLKQVMLLFTVIAGVMSVLFGIYARLNDKAVAFIGTKILTIPEISVRLAASSNFTATDVFRICTVLLSRGLFTDLLKIILAVSFWLLVRLAVKLVLIFFGVGIADTLASLVIIAVSFIVAYAAYLKTCTPLPKVEIVSITFNHDLNQSNTSAMNLRVNKDTEVHIPEYQATSQVQSPVAYIRNVGDRERPVFIKVKFMMQSYYPMYTVSIRGVAENDNILGDVPEFNCNFYFGNSSYQEVTLTNNKINNSNVGAYNATWKWQYQDPASGQWENIGTTTNELYIVPQTPLPPWDLAGKSKEKWPWADILKIACQWTNQVNGNDVQKSVRSQLTEGLNKSGFKYKSGHMYSKRSALQSTIFYATDFLTVYNGENDKKLIECAGCSIVLTIFSKILGIEMYENLLMYYFNNTSKKLNTTHIKSIGYKTWDTHKWDYHMVASHPDNNQDVKKNQIFDACLAMNGSNDPWPTDAPANDIQGIVPGFTDHMMKFTVQQDTANMVWPDLPYTEQGSYIERLLKKDDSINLSEYTFMYQNVEKGYNVK